VIAPSHVGHQFRAHRTLRQLCQHGSRWLDETPGLHRAGSQWTTNERHARRGEECRFPLCKRACSDAQTVRPKVVQLGSDARTSGDACSATRAAAPALAGLGRIEWTLSTSVRSPWTTVSSRRPQLNRTRWLSTPANRRRSVTQQTRPCKARLSCVIAGGGRNTGVGQATVS
jgi:hypothetical protein